MSIKINIFASSTTGLGGWAYKGGVPEPGYTPTTFNIV